MSHADEGTLHAYLDGELPPVERERVDAHLKGCPACQARLAEERALIERAGRLLGMATPPEQTMPPLQELRQPRLTWRLRRPLAWAATVILAVGLGWYARGSFATRATATATAEQDTRRAEPAAAPTTPAATSPAGLSDAAAPPARDEQRVQGSMSQDRGAERELAAGRAVGAANNALALRQAAEATQALDSARVDAAAQLPSALPVVSTRGARPPAAPAPTAAAAARSSVIEVDGAIAQRRAPALLSTEWPLIGRRPARDVLGVEPVVIPGFAVRAYRRNPAAREIVVEQVTDAGTTISLIERRVDSFAYDRAEGAAAHEPRAMAQSVNERLARFVGRLRVEIDGPLTPDSLSGLLELAR